MKIKEFLLAVVLLLNCGAVVAQNDSVGRDSMVFSFQVDPEFPGGIVALYDYLCRNVSYPAEAREQGISGKVFVSFAVERDGSVADVKIQKDIGGGCGEAVVEAVKNMPRWMPGRIGGKPVRMGFTLPVSFSLEDEEDPETEGMTREEKCHYRFTKYLSR